MKSFQFFALVILLTILGCKNKIGSKNLINASVIKTIKQNPDCSIFEITHFDDENFLQSEIKPTNLLVLPDEQGEFLVKGFIISDDKSVRNCFLDIHLTERISDFVIYDLNNPKVGYTSDFFIENDVIPAVASDCFGSYEFYYSRIAPELSIDVLRKGLEISANKTHIAEELGYVFRDENRFEESLKYFLFAEKNGNISSEYIIQEILGLYQELGNELKVKEYQEKLKIFFNNQIAIALSLSCMIF